MRVTIYAYCPNLAQRPSHSQITESQLHYSGGSGLASTRYTFRPSGPTLSAAGALSAGTPGGAGPAGSTVSTGAAPSLSRGGVSTYRSPIMPASSGGGAGGLGSGVAGTGSYIGGASAGTTPTSTYTGRVAAPSGGAAAPGSAPGTGGSGYGSSLYTGHTGGYSSYSRHSGAASGGGPPAATVAARSLNLGGAADGSGGAAAPAATGVSMAQASPPLLPAQLRATSMPLAAGVQ